MSLLIHLRELCLIPGFAALLAASVYFFGVRIVCALASLEKIAKLEIIYFVGCIYLTNQWMLFVSDGSVAFFN